MVEKIMTLAFKLKQYFFTALRVYDSREKFPLLELSPELLASTFSLLSICSIGALCQVCRLTNAILEEEQVWKVVCRRNWRVKEEEHIKVNWRGYAKLQTFLSFQGNTVLIGLGSSSYVFSGEMFRWQEIIPAGGLWPVKRYNHTSTLMGDRLFIIGGQSSDTSDRFEDVLIFDIGTYVWC